MNTAERCGGLERQKLESATIEIKMLKSTHKPRPPSGGSLSPLPAGWTEHRAPTGTTAVHNDRRALLSSWNRSLLLLQRYDAAVDLYSTSFCRRKSTTFAPATERQPPTIPSQSEYIWLSRRTWLLEHRPESESRVYSSLPSGNLPRKGWRRSRRITPPVS